MTQAHPLRWRLYPHRSLGRQGYRTMMIALGVVSLLAALRFYVLHAWPVVIFLFVDVALIYWAFRLSYAQAAAYEEVEIADGKIIVRQVSHRGVARQHEFNAYWASVILEQINQVQCRLLLVAQGRQLEFGTFLAPFERFDIHADIERGLAQARLAAI